MPAAYIRVKLIAAYEKKMDNENRRPMKQKAA
jgi:hypothetical protein